MKLSEQSRFRISPRISLLLARNRRSHVLRSLDKIILDDYGLFRRDQGVLHDRQAAIQFKIDLLLEWGRYSEALAWLCLETEVNPENVLAEAMKQRLKRRLRIDDLERGGSPSEPSPMLTRSAPIVDWTGIAGMRELKVTLERDIILPQFEPEIYRRYKVPLPSGILFYGPPGCGKTFIARHLAKVLDRHFMDLKPSDLASIYVHGTQEKIGQTFTEAAKKAPTIIFFDEIDAFIPSREQGLYQHYSAEVNEFLAQMNDCHKRGILVIGATNYLNKVDVAVRRPGRFDKKIYVGPPDVEARIEAMKMYMSERPQDSIDYCEIVANKEMYSYADLELIINDAARDALQQKAMINSEFLLAAFKRFPPSITPAMIGAMSLE